jgi:hypothetical protein
MKPTDLSTTARGSVSDYATFLLTRLDQEMVVAKLNRTMIGWANYFCSKSSEP